MTQEFFIFISHVEAVGMHHWGPKHLNVGSTYVLRADITNIVDGHAISVHECSFSGTKRAYVISEWARKLQPIIAYCNMALIRVQEEAIVLVYDKGPQHDCTVILRCTDINKNVVETHLKALRIMYTMKEQN